MSNEMDKEKLVAAVKKAQQGDASAFATIYEETYKSKYYIALKFMNNEQDAEDVLQDAYVKAFNSIGTLKEPENVSAWLTMIVSNTAKNALKKNKPVLFSDMSSEDEEGEEFVYEAVDDTLEHNPEANYTQKETSDMLKIMLDKLSTEQKMTVIMFYYEGLSIREIAEAMDCNENTVKSRLNLGRKNLKLACDDLEKKGYSIRSFAPVGLFLYLLAGEGTFIGSASAASIPACKAYASAAELSKEAIKAATVVKKAGFLSTLFGKAVVTGVVLLGVSAAVFAGVKIAGSGDKDSGKNPSVTVTSEEPKATNTPVPTDTPAPTTTPTPDPLVEKMNAERELLRSYMEEELVPRYSKLGSYDYNTVTIDWVEDMNTLSGLYVYSMSEENAKGIVGSALDDFDNDDTQELVVFYIESYYETNAASSKNYMGGQLKYIVCTINNGEIRESEPYDFVYENSFIANNIDKNNYSWMWPKTSANELAGVPNIIYAWEACRNIKLSTTKDSDGNSYFIFEAEVEQEKSAPGTMRSVWSYADGKLVISAFSFEVDNPKSDEDDDYYQTEYLNIVMADDEEKAEISYSYDYSGDMTGGYSIGEATGYVKDESNYGSMRFKDVLDSKNLKENKFRKVFDIDCGISFDKPDSSTNSRSLVYYAYLETGVEYYHVYYFNK